MKLNGKSINYNVQTVDELVSLDGLEGDTVVVTDENRGGVFVYREDNVGTNNGGTIFNGWTRQYDGAVNVKWFGAKGDGITDDTESFKEAIAYANTNNKKLVADRGMSIKLTGADIITVSTSCDFNGALFDISEFSGSIRIRNTAGFINYILGDTVFDAVYNTGTLSSGDVVGWSGLEEVNDSFVILYSDNQPYYSYRGDVITRKDYNRISRYGKTYSMFTDLDTYKLTQVSVMKMPDRFLTFENCSFYVGSNDISHQFLMVEQAAMVNISNIVYKFDDYELDEESPSWLWIMKSCQVKCTNIYFERANRNIDISKYGYLIQFQDNYDLVFEGVKGVGNGWGSIGGNDTQLLSYINCELNRIDAHRPLREKLLIKGCKIGSNGMTLSIIGNTYIEDTDFIFVNSDDSGNEGFINNRVDNGCILQGNLYINNCSLQSDVDTALLRAYLIESNPIPATSPLDDNCYFKDIYINNFEFKGQNRYNLMPYIYSPHNTIRYPLSITYSNIAGNVYANRNISAFTPRFSASDTDFTDVHNLKLSFNNIRFNTEYDLSIIDTTPNNFKILLECNNCTQIGETSEGLNVELLFNGLANITLCALKKIDSISGTANLKPLKIVIDKSSLANSSSALISFTGNGNYAQKSKISIVNSKVYGLNTYLKYLALAYLNGNTYYSEVVTDSNILAVTAELNATSGTLSLPSERTDNNNRYAIDIGGVLYPFVAHKTTGIILLNVGTNVISLNRTITSPNIYITQTGTSNIGAIYILG